MIDMFKHTTKFTQVDVVDNTSGVNRPRLIGSLLALAPDVLNCVSLGVDANLKGSR